MAKKKAGNVFLWIVMLLLIAGLAGFGVTSFSGGSNTVAAVGDTEIEADDYVRALDAQMRNFQQQTGQQLTFSQARAFGLDGQVLGQLIGAAALENEASELGLSIGDENVSREITASPNFRGMSGEFDRDTYRMTLEQNGIAVRDYEERIRGEISAGILRSAVAGGISTPDLFVDTLFKYAREERDVTWARLDTDDLAEPLPEPSEDALRAFYDENPDPFTEAETRAIDYAWLTPDMIVDDIEVAEDQVRELYDAQIDEFMQPERRLVERLVFTTEAAAADALDQIEADDTTFDELIAKRGLTLEDADLGEATREELGDAGDAVFTLNEPGVVGPLPSPLGPALYRMNGILAAQETTFDDVRDELAAEAATDRARRIIIGEIGRIEDLLAGGATPETLAERTDMEAGQIDWREDVSDGIAAYDAFRDAAASATLDGFPEVIELDDGGIVVLSLTEIREPTLKPFDDVRNDVVTAWETAETEKALKAQASALADRLRESAEMAGLGLDLETDRSLGRNGFVEGTPADFIDTVFDMEPEEVRVLSAAGDAWLVRLDAIHEPDATTAEAQAVRAQFGAESARTLADSLLTAYSQAVLDQTGISLNQGTLNAVHAQLP